VDELRQDRGTLFMGSEFREGRGPRRQAVAGRGGR
jgi:hypothetical protein